MNRHPLLVLDPENSDATFGALEEAEIWMVKNGYNVWHTGVALESGKVGERVSVSDLIEAARAVVKAANMHWFGDNRPIYNLNKILTRING
jgi:hypothetical protein